MLPNEGQPHVCDQASCPWPTSQALEQYNNESMSMAQAIQIAESLTSSDHW